ncbi:MAG: hypothetical protein B6D39_01105 [Anaerolineae bacterium UTCFX2]|jgi:hypothetical protein|nr:DUF3054 domain-containing protein [Anaerolineae bacterium]MCZ7553107.1 DUF3054 domain-containing protein [Anaerolineales bacterium]OQY94677.1 MAG: hypothetical protein B6D39_01105 [Anaerolineae bacterium UTCFX2]
MQSDRFRRQRIVLIAGDIIVFVLVTVFGFSTHGTLGTAGLRILAIFVPFTLAWFAVGPLMGVYRFEIVQKPAWLWVPAWATLVAAPLAILLRAIILNVPILPLFVLIMGGVSAAGILIWRGLFYWFSVRRSQFNG